MKMGVRRQRWRQKSQCRRAVTSQKKQALRSSGGLRRPSKAFEVRRCAYPVSMLLRGVGYEKHAEDCSTCVVYQGSQIQSWFSEGLRRLVVDDMVVH